MISSLEMEKEELEKQIRNSIYKNRYRKKIKKLLKRSKAIGIEMKIEIEIIPAIAQELGTTSNKIRNLVKKILLNR